MTERPQTPDDSAKDVVDLLRDQHQQIRGLFNEVETSTPEHRQEAFDRLRRFLAVHETAEEEIVHPLARKAANGEAVVEARLTEEHAAKRMLAELEDMGADSPQFPPRFAEFRRAVLDHAEHEEREEFPRLRTTRGEQELRSMATVVKAAEAIAPTHPHPGTESATANLLGGPFTSMLDRSRDLLRKAIGR